MLFNSFDFAIFLPLVFILYWFVFNRNLNLQNFLVVVASYVFYGWWDWRFLFLIFVSTVLDFLVGLSIRFFKDKWAQKSMLWLSIIINIGMLGTFKYYNFFLDSFRSAFSIFGYGLTTSSLNVILPVGISFYTFQTLSYTIDIYKKKLDPTTNFIAFSAFVSFFPQLVAGPIERAKNFLPQFLQQRKFEYPQAVDGLRQILWGIFKKVVIADNCAIFVNFIFANQGDLSGSTLFLGAVFFIFQIYGDFSGYSDIAIGTARLFGFNLMQNFAFPLFSRDIPEFWRRWHISLTTWFRDYVYLPLSRRGYGPFFRIRNIFILFLLTGLWHGANWTFVTWGVLNAVYFLPYLLIRKVKTNSGVVGQNSFFPSLTEIFQVGRSFFLMLIGIVFFRALTFDSAILYLENMFSLSFFSIPYYRGLGLAKPLIILIVLMLFVEWTARKHKHGLEHVDLIQWRWLRWIVYIFLITLTGIFMWTGSTDFIYFQF